VCRGARSLGGLCSQIWGRWLRRSVLVCLLSDQDMGWGGCWGSRRWWLHAALSVIQLGDGCLRLCLGTLSAAECQMLIRIIKASYNTSSNDACASGALLGRPSHDAVLHRACTRRPLPALSSPKSQAMSTDSLRMPSTLLTPSSGRKGPLEMSPEAPSPLLPPLSCPGLPPPAHGAPTLCPSKLLAVAFGSVPTTSLWIGAAGTGWGEARTSPQAAHLQREPRHCPG